MGLLAAALSLAACENAITVDVPPLFAEGEGEAGEGEGEAGEGEGEDPGVVIECGEREQQTLEAVANRFATEIHPLMMRQGNGCIECHQGDSGRALTLTADPQESFFRIRAAGFFRLTEGTAVTRVVDQSMPLGDAASKWTDAEADLLVELGCDLATVDEAGVPPDEEFPPDLLLPYTGAPPTEWDNTFLTYDQLRARVLQAFDDEWVREGVDGFSENISLFGGVDFLTTFVPARQATPEFLVGLDLMAEDVCGRAALDASGPFSGLDLDASIQNEPASTLSNFEAEGPGVQIIGLPTGCLPGPTSTRVTLCTNATISTTLQVPISGDYRLRAFVVGDPNAAGPPLLSVRVDSDEVLNTAVPETTLVERSIVTRLEAGSRIFSVAFTNDNNDGGDDRNLIVDRISVEGPLPGTTDGSATGRADALSRIATVFERLLLRSPNLTGVEATDEVLPLYAMMLALRQSDGDVRGGWAGVCEALVGHPDFLFTRPAAFDTATGGERERLLLIKTAFDLIGRPPSSAEFNLFDAGQTREEILDAWMASTEFRDLYYHRVRQILESDGTVDGDEPARLWTYIAMNDLPLREVLTAEYTVDESFARVERPSVHGATGILTMKGYIRGKPGLPHYNYAARVLTGFMGVVFEVPQEALDARATATASSTVDPTSLCYSCHRTLTPLAYQRQRWDDEGNYRTQFEDGREIDDSDQGIVADYAFAGPGIQSFSLVAVRKEGFIRKMANTHFQLSFGRNLRHAEDERVLYKALFDNAQGGAGTFRQMLRTVLLSQSYTNPVVPESM